MPVVIFAMGACPMVIEQLCDCMCGCGNGGGYLITHQWEELPLCNGECVCVCVSV